MRIQPRYPIFIPSKGRAHNLKTAKALDRDDVSYKVVVEPSQVESYVKVVGEQRLLVLPENGKGLVYSRNWITDHAKTLGTERHWQIDDDISDFYRVYRGMRLRCDAAGWAGCGREQPTLAAIASISPVPSCGMLGNRTCGGTWPTRSSVWSGARLYGGRSRTVPAQIMIR